MAAPPDIETWLRLVDAQFFDDVADPACTYCNPKTNDPTQVEEGDPEAGPSNPQKRQAKERKSPQRATTSIGCKHFFCVPCKQGALCKQEFDHEGGLHFGHKRLQIFRTSYKNSVKMEDIADCELDTKDVMRISSNNDAMHQLNTRRESTAIGNLLYCHGCHQNVANAKSTYWKKLNAKKAMVCSIQCLTVYRGWVPPTPGRTVHRRKLSRPERSPLM